MLPQKVRTYLYPHKKVRCCVCYYTNYGPSRDWIESPILLTNQFYKTDKNIMAKTRFELARWYPTRDFHTTIIFITDYINYKPFVVWTISSSVLDALLIVSTHAQHIKNVFAWLGVVIGKDFT